MKNLLLPHYCKMIGASLIMIGLVFAILYLKFDFNYTSPVFALISIFLENKFFVITKTNIVDELTLIFFVVGFAMLVFSKEKIESDSIQKMREKAIMKATAMNCIFLLFSILFIYGGGFIGVLIFNSISVFIFYLILFNLNIRKNTKKSGDL